MRISTHLWATALSLCPALVGSAARAEDVAFVEASSELDDGKPQTTAYNAVDGKPATAWCTKRDGASGAILSFGFDTTVTVTHIGLVVGEMKGDALDKTNQRARVVFVGDAEHLVEAKFKDDGPLQTLELTPPAKGRHIVVEFRDGYAGAAPDAPLCVAEVVLKNKDQLLTGERTASRLRALNAPSKRLLHEWLDDVAAPQRTLLFNVDGTFTYRFEPLLEGKPAKVRGKWSAIERAVILEVGGHVSRLDARLSKVDDGDTHTVELTLSGDPPTPSMAATFRPAPLKLP